MKTFWQIRDSVMEAIHSYEITDDTPIELEMIEDKILDIRSSLINEEAKSGSIDPAYYMAIENIPIYFPEKEIQISDSVSIKNLSNLGIIELPWLYTRIGNKAISYLGLPDFSMCFDYKTMQGIVSQKHALHTKCVPSYSLISNKAYIANYGRSGKSYVSLIAVIDDVRRVPGYKEGETPFHVSDPQKLELLTIKHFMTTMGVKPDKINDANADMQ